MEVQMGLCNFKHKKNPLQVPLEGPPKTGFVEQNLILRCHEMFSCCFSISHTHPPLNLFGFPCRTLTPSHHRHHQLQLKQQQQQPKRIIVFSYEVGGGYAAEEQLHHRNEPDIDTSAQREALLNGGEQVISVLQEMITLLEEMDIQEEESEKVAVELAAQGVIGKRVDQMESDFMLALDYMIQLAEQDQDDKVISFLNTTLKKNLIHFMLCSIPYRFVYILCKINL